MHWTHQVLLSILPLFYGCDIQLDPFAAPWHISVEDDPFVEVDPFSGKDHCSLCYGTNVTVSLTVGQPATHHCWDCGEKMVRSDAGGLIAA